MLIYFHSKLSNKSLKLGITSGVLLLNSFAYAIEGNLSLNLGHDTNPLTLSEENLSGEGGFIFQSVQLSETLSQWSEVQANASRKKFEGSYENADQKQHGYKVKLKFSHKAFRKYYTTHRLDLAYEAIDKTYLAVDGSEASLGDLNLANRYDRSSHMLEQRNRIKINPHNRIYLSLFGSENDFKDFSTINDLDNENYGVNSRWRYSQKKHHIDLDLENNITSYQDLPSKTLVGDDIENKLLRIKQLTYGVNYSYGYYQNTKWNHRVNLSVSENRDHESGYFDNNNKNLSYSSQFNLSAKNSLSLKVAYYDIDFSKRQNDSLEIESDITTSARYDFLSISQQYLFHSSEQLDATYNLTLSKSNYKSSVKQYSYKQNIVSTGVTISF